MEMQESWTKGQKICRVAYVLGEHNPAPMTQAAAGLGKPGGPLGLTSQFMDGEQAENNVGGFRRQRPGIITTGKRAGRRWKQRACPVNGRLGHSRRVIVVKSVPSHIAKTLPQFLRSFVKAAVAEDALAHGNAFKGTIEPGPAIQGRTVIDYVGDT
jgi:hypothetical protein